MWCRCWL